MAMVESTLSTSRLELTASPTSRSASSSSTFFASSAPLASSSWTSLMALTAMAACAANAETMAISRSSNGLTSLRQTPESADDLVVEEHRRAHGRPEPRHPLQVVAAVLRVGQHVGDLLGPSVEPDPAEQGVPVHGHRVFGDQPERLLGEAHRLDQPVDAVLEDVEMAACDRHSRRALSTTRREDGVRVAGRAAQRGEHLVGGRELVGQVDVVLEDAGVLLRVDGARGRRRLWLGHRYLPPPMGRGGDLRVSSPSAGCGNH